MEDNKTLIDSIKNLMVKFGFISDKEIQEAETIYFYEDKLLDGTIVRIEGDSIAVGAKVSIISEDGEVPAPDGEYTLEDESTFIVKDGMIESIPEMVEPEIETPEVETPEEVVIPVEDTQMSELIDMLKEFIANISEKMTAMETKNAELSAQVAEFSKLPAGLPIPNGKTTTEINPVNSRLDAISGFRNKK